jgi:hypothetical protein
MWQRRSFHECAEELHVVCCDFRGAYLNKGSHLRARDDVMRETSVRGVEILRILALAVRSEQDFGYLDRAVHTVGAVLKEADAVQVMNAVGGLYRPPYSALAGYEPLGLRDALNKFAHADPGRAGFHVSDQTHDLILTGRLGHKDWIAVVSLLDVVSAIRRLPDTRLPGG